MFGLALLICVFGGWCCDLFVCILVCWIFFGLFMFGFGCFEFVDFGLLFACWLDYLCFVGLMFIPVGVVLFIDWWWLLFVLLDFDLLGLIFVSFCIIGLLLDLGGFGVLILFVFCGCLRWFRVGMGLLVILGL